MGECGVTSHLFDPKNDVHSQIILALQTFGQSYGMAHRYASFSLCVLGVLANLLHIAILTRPVMKRSPVNRLLAFMAGCDSVTMLSYLLYMIRFGLLIDRENPPFGYEYVWICYLLAHVVLSIALHTISLYLSVATAFIRLTAISRIQSRVMRPQIAWKISTTVCATVSLLSIPTFLVHDILPSDDTPGLYYVSIVQSGGHRCALLILNLWLTGVFFKAIPCILLFIFTLGLLYKLHLNKISHEKIASKQSTQMRCAQSDRTTLLLIILLAVFLITELPQGALAILNAIYPEDVGAYIYNSVGEFFDLLSFINGSMCCILYPCISSQYRETFSLLVARARSRAKNYRAVAKPKVPASSTDYRSVETEYLALSLDPNPEVCV